MAGNAAEWDGRVTEVDGADDSQWIVWPDAGDESVWVEHELAVDWAAAAERSTRHE